MMRGVLFLLFGLLSGGLIPNPSYFCNAYSFIRVPSLRSTLLKTHRLTGAGLIGTAAHSPAPLFSNKEDFSDPSASSSDAIDKFKESLSATRAVEAQVRTEQRTTMPTVMMEDDEGP